MKANDIRDLKDDEILEQVAVHARDDHGMPEVPPEVADRILEQITETSG